MSNSKQTSTNQDANAAVIAAEKRVILLMGGKGGVGKTSVMAGLAEWFEENDIPVKLLDLDIENKARGSLTHFFGGSVPKVNIHTPAGLDSFVDQLADGPTVILADMGDRGCFRWQRLLIQDCDSASRSSPRSNSLNLTRSRGPFLASGARKKGDEVST
jgi:Mrp family chromosome partitioning ATPase